MVSVKINGRIFNTNNDVSEILEKLVDKINELEWDTNKSDYASDSDLSRLEAEVDSIRDNVKDLQRRFKDAGEGLE